MAMKVQGKVLECALERVLKDESFLSETIKKFQYRTPIRIRTTSK